MAPLVREYTADAPIPGPFQTRQARDLDTGNVGGALSRVGSDIADIGGELHRHEAQTEISQLGVKLSAAHAQLGNDLDTALSAPGAGNNKTLASDYMEKVDNTLSDIGNSISTPEAQAHFAENAAQIRANLFVSAVHGQSKAAGEQMVANYGTTKDNLTTAAYNNPSSLQTLLNRHSSAVDAMVQPGSGVTQQHADELRASGETDIAMGAAKGMMNIDPVSFQKQLNAPKNQWDQYFNADQKYQLTRMADSAVNSQEIQKDKALAAQKRVQEAQTQAWQNQYAAGVRNGDTSQQFKDLIAHPPDGTKWQDIEAMQKYQKYNQDVKFDTNKGAMAALYQRIHSEGADKITSPGQVYSLAAGLVSPRDTDYLVKEMQSKDNPDAKNEAQMKESFVKMALNKLNPLPLTPGQVTEDQQGFLGAFLPEYEKQVQAGKKPVDLLTPGRPDYMGYMIHAMAQTPEQAISNIVHGPQNVQANQLAPGSAITQSPAASAPSTGTPQGQVGPYGAFVNQGGHQYNWNAKTGKYE